MRDLNATLSSRDWAPLFAAFAEVLEWLLDRAQLFAREYPEEVAAVERIRVFVRKRAAGFPAHARIDDVLFTFGLIAGAIEQQRQLDRATKAAARTARAELAASHESRAKSAELAPSRLATGSSRIEVDDEATRIEPAPSHVDVEVATRIEQAPSSGDKPAVDASRVDEWADAPSPHPRVFARGTTRMPTKRAPRPGASPAVRVRRPS